MVQGGILKGTAEKCRREYGVRGGVCRYNGGEK